MTRIALAVLLAVIYLLVIGSLSAGDIAFGAALGIALTMLPRSLRMRKTAARPRVIVLLCFVIAIVLQLLRGSVTVLAVLLGLRSWRRAGFVRVPVGERTELGVAVSGLVLTASPGTALVEVDEETGTILLHTIDASDPEATRRRFDDFYRRRQKEVVP